MRRDDSNFEVRESRAVDVLAAITGAVNSIPISEIVPGVLDMFGYILLEPSRGGGTCLFVLMFCDGVPLLRAWAADSKCNPSARRSGKA